MSPHEAHERLVATGSRYEMESIVIRGIENRVWKHAPRSLKQIFNVALAFGEREFLILEDERVTYAAFGKATLTLAAALRERGVRQGDVVAIILPNRPEWVVAYFAVVLVGAIAAPLSPASPPAEKEFSLKDSGAKVVIIDGDRLADTLPILDRIPAVENILASGRRSDVGDPRVGYLADILGEVAGWKNLAPSGVPDVELDPDDVATIFYTSGTTGTPKGVITTHRNLIYNIFHAGFRNARRFLLSGELPPEPDPHKAPQQSALVTLPLFHVSGSANSILPLMARGAKIVFMRAWFAELGLRLIEHERVNIMSCVPTIPFQMLQHPNVARYDLSSIDQIVFGGGPAPMDLAGKITAAGITPGQNWGMTETAGGVIGHIGPEYVRRPSSCGLPAPVMDIKIMDLDGNVRLPAGEIGELWIKGPQVMPGYWNNQDATAEVLRDGWLRTGDLATLDSDGYCVMVDRAKDMLICAGENIYCGEVERALGEHEGIAEVAVLGLAHATYGQVPAAVVVARSDVALSERELRIFAASRLAQFKVPTRIVVTSEPLPRNAGGKVSKGELAHLFEVV